MRCDGLNEGCVEVTGAERDAVDKAMQKTCFETLEERIRASKTVEVKGTEFHGAI